MSLAAAIFDFDGVILDTEGTAFESWSAVYREHGVVLTWEDYAISVGTAHAWDAVANLERLAGRRLDRDLVKARHREIYRPLAAALKLMPGVAERLDEADRLGIRLALASSSTFDWVVEHLKGYGIMDRFSAILVRDDRLRAKPHPDLYLASLRALGVPADEAVAFEDSMNGVTAAKAAGLFCVAVPNSMTARMDLSRADLMAKSLMDVSFASLTTAVARTGV